MTQGTPILEAAVNTGIAAVAAPVAPALDPLVDTALTNIEVGADAQLEKIVTDNPEPAPTPTAEPAPAPVEAPAPEAPAVS